MTRRVLLVISCALLLAGGASTLACSAGHQLAALPTPQILPGGPSVAWLGPTLDDDRRALARWRRSVGPPVAVVAPPAENRPADRVIIVNWNLHVGGGDVDRLLADVRRQSGEELPVVFLLQEAYRAGPEVPNELAGDSRWASVIRGLRRDGSREEIESVASRLALHAYYVPSMRNGEPLTSDEDRGNAILSTLPLSELAAIELPFERQRRVAVAATVRGTTSAGRPWRLRVVSAHLDNMVGARRLWFAGGAFARARQARGLIAALDGESPLVLGADLNTWFGFRDTAYRETVRAFPQTVVTDRRSTFRGLLRLDHLFFRLAPGWKASFRRADENYGSDHYPLIGRIDITASR